MTTTGEPEPQRPPLSEATLGRPRVALPGLVDRRSALHGFNLDVIEVVRAAAAGPLAAEDPAARKALEAPVASPAKIRSPVAKGSEHA